MDELDELYGWLLAGAALIASIAISHYFFIGRGL